MIVPNAKTLAAIRRLPCCWCGRFPSQAAHLYAKGFGGGYRNDSETNLAPLCVYCHAAHHSGQKPGIVELLQEVSARLALPLEIVRAHCMAVRREPKLPPKEARVRADELLEEISRDFGLRHPVSRDRGDWRGLRGVAPRPAP